MTNMAALSVRRRRQQQRPSSRKPHYCARASLQDNDDDDDDSDENEIEHKADVYAQQPLIAAYDYLQKDAVEWIKKAQEPAHISVLAEDHERIIDARPPHVQLLACEEEYCQLLQKKEHRLAIHSLVTRVSLLRLVYGRLHIRVARALVTVGRAYFELLNYHKQALDHGRRVQDMYTKLKASRKEHHLRNHELMELSTSALLLIGQALVETGNPIEGEQALTRSLHLLTKLKQHKGHKTDEEEVPNEQVLTKCPGKIDDTRVVQNSHIRSIVEEEIRLRTYLCKAFLAQDKSQEALKEAAHLKALANSNRTRIDSGLAITSYCTLAWVSSDPADKISFMETACNMATEGGKDLNIVVQCQRQLAEAHAAAGNLEVADEFLRNALRILGDDFSQFSDAILSTQESRARILVRLQRHGEAVNMLEDLKRQVEEYYGILSKRTANVNHFLGSIFLSLGDATKAIQCFEQRLHTLIHTRGSSHRLTQETKALLESLRV